MPWLPSEVDTDELLLGYAWYESQSPGFARLRQRIEASRIRRSQGMVGRVFAGGEPEFATDCRCTAVAPQRAFRGSMGCFKRHVLSPSLRAKESLAYSNSSATKQIEPTEQRLEMMASVGTLLGRVIEREQTSRELKASEERFRMFMDNSPAVAWMKDEEGRYAYLSKSFERRFHVLLADCRGKTDFDLWPQEIAEEFRTNDIAVLRDETIMEAVEQAPNPDGTISFWWNFRFPFQDEKGIRYVGGIGFDITKEKQSEKALRKSEEALRESEERSEACISGQ